MCRLLVVDDDPVSRMALAGAARRLGADVATAIDGEEAVELVGRRAFDVVLLDMRLPGIDGHETARRLRLASPGPVRIVAVSATWSDGDTAAAVAAGLTERLLKPVDVETLAGLLGTAAASPTPESPPTDFPRLHEATFRAFRRDVCANASTAFNDVLAMILTRLAGQLDAALSAEPAAARSIAHTARASASWLGARRLAQLLSEMEDADTTHELLGALARDARTELAEVEREIGRFLRA